MIENITNIVPIETSVSVIHSLLSFGYWSLGGAVGIAIITVIFNLFYKRKHLKALKKIVSTNQDILEELKKLNRKNKAF